MDGVLPGAGNDRIPLLDHGSGGADQVIDATDLGLDVVDVNLGGRTEPSLVIHIDELRHISSSMFGSGGIAR